MPRLEELPAELIADVVSRAVADSVRLGGDTETIVARALSRARKDLDVGDIQENKHVPATASTPPTEPASADGVGGRFVHNQPAGSRRVGASLNGHRPVVTEDDVLAARREGQTELRLPAGAIITALARDAAKDSGIRIVEEGR